jgi:multiple sugar transport system ATP-binding protein
VAGFIGSPATNFLEGHLNSSGVETASGIVLPVADAPSGSEGRPVHYGIRPEHLELSDTGVDAEVIVVEPTGSETQLFVRVDGREVVAVSRERHDLHPGQNIKLQPRPGAAMIFDHETGQRI